MLEIFPKSNLFNNRRLTQFIKHFAKDDNWHKLDSKNGGLGYGLVHYSLIRILKPNRVLCIGSRWGFIPAICAMACKDNRKGKVHFIDAGYDMDNPQASKAHWGGMGFWKKCDSSKHFGKFGLEKYVTLYVMTSSEYIKKHQKSLYGYVHVDGDHSYKGVKSDFNMFWPKIESGGFLAIHDIGSPDKDGNIYGTRKFWKELKKNSKYSCLEFNEDPGIGIIQKY